MKSWWQHFASWLDTVTSTPWRHYLYDFHTSSQNDSFGSSRWLFNYLRELVTPSKLLAPYTWLIKLGKVIKFQHPIYYEDENNNRRNAKTVKMTALVVPVLITWENNKHDSLREISKKMLDFQSLGEFCRNFINLDIIIYDARCILAQNGSTTPPPAPSKPVAWVGELGHAFNLNILECCFPNNQNGHLLQH